MSEEEDFKRLLEDYLQPDFERNPALANVRIGHVRNKTEYGALHMWEKHRVTEQEVEEVILETPPAVEAKRDPDHAGRLLFLGATRKRRQPSAGFARIFDLRFAICDWLRITIVERLEESWD